jgi:hypothetical protein
MARWILRSGAAAAAVVLASLPAVADLAAATKAYGALLGRYVTSRGVRYEAWRASGSDLKTISEVVMLYRSTDPGPLEPNERKALYINLYNSRILETVLFGNPAQSIRDLSKGLRPGEVFDRLSINFDRRGLSLNALEKKLRDEFKDPRTHFALSCACKSSARLRPEPYVATELDDQLDDATRKFLSAPGSVEVVREGGKTRVVVSKIFDVFADDFKAAGGALAFVAKFGPRDAAEAIASGKVKLDFADYDWDLDAAK